MSLSLSQDQGNALFKAGKYKEAIEEYSKAMALIEGLDKAAESRGGPVAQSMVGPGA